MKIFGVVGWKNAGKTGLMERLVTEISARGFSVSTVKHAHHSFDVDHPGKDSHRHRVAGATEVLLSSRRRWALMHENRGTEEPPLADLLVKIAPVDLVLIEGYKRDAHHKIEAYREETGNALIASSDNTVVAVASDCKLESLSIPVIDLDDTKNLADFILTKVGLVQENPPTPGPEIKPQRLSNDCFALPAGVNWIPVDQALENLRQSLSVVVAKETIQSAIAAGRVLAADVFADRSNPPAPNSAVDGYGFSHAGIGTGAQSLKLIEGRAAAGAPFTDHVLAGQAIRVLTGAILPAGVDCVILQEDVTVAQGHVAFDGEIKLGSNTRKAGEDVAVGDVVLRSGHLLRPQDVALLSAVGCKEISVYQQLRVGVLSTGDEIVPVASETSEAKTYDANRPMLLELIRKWGYVPIDLGQVGDDRQVLKVRLNNASDCSGENVDIILTSGGASGGDEDHVSALLKQEGALTSWRIAVKPGRPLALGVWNGVPLIGLPGNPVAAFVCTLIFARPALSALAGGHWLAAQSFMVPARFEKRKKPGRREFLRAKMAESGEVEVFASEGSGRISGLSWADGLVELDDDAREIRIGDLVRYYPYSSFGI